MDNATYREIMERCRAVVYACHCDCCDGVGYDEGCGDTECGTYQCRKILELLED